MRSANEHFLSSFDWPLSKLSVFLAVSLASQGNGTFSWQLAAKETFVKCIYACFHFNMYSNMTLQFALANMKLNVSLCPNFNCVLERKL
jgi:hypothetical protein